MAIPTTCDVTIIGGGPAGSFAAATLAEKGYHVVVLEKTSHPRPTVGESLIPDFWRYTDQIGATEKMEAEGGTDDGRGGDGYPEAALHEVGGETRHHDCDVDEREPSPGNRAAA